MDEFFQCPCSGKGDVILDGSNEGPNKDDADNLLPKQCNAGQHVISLECSSGRRCSPKQVEIKDTDPISPMQVAFQCE
ncbi:MAG: hypothetical protein ABSE05_09610 [Syntrophales bacterium]